MGKKGKERAKERRRQRLEEIAELREVPYSPSERYRRNAHNPLDEMPQSFTYVYVYA